MRRLFIAAALLSCTVALAGEHVANISPIWVEPASSTTPATLLHGISRSCVTCPTPHSFINLPQTPYNNCRVFATLLASSPPTAADRTYFRSLMPMIAQAYWDNSLLSDDERDAVIEAYRHAPEW